MLREYVKSRRYSKAALRMTLQLCAAAIVVCTLAVASISSRRTAAEERDALGTRHIQNARARLARANEQLDLINKYRERYRQLLREGLTVRFDRSVAGDWFDMAIHAVPVGAIDDYMIGKDVPYAGPETAELTAFHVVAHRLEFNASAADEDEFAELMSSLEKHVPGTTAQEACSLTRNRETTEGATAPLALKCALIWYEFTPSNTMLSATAAGS